MEANAWIALHLTLAIVCLVGVITLVIAVLKKDYVRLWSVILFIILGAFGIAINVTAALYHTGLLNF